jgi:hypothetical protein
MARNKPSGIREGGITDGTCPDENLPLFIDAIMWDFNKHLF